MVKVGFVLHKSSDTKKEASRVVVRQSGNLTGITLEDADHQKRFSCSIPNSSMLFSSSADELGISGRVVENNMAVVYLGILCQDVVYACIERTVDKIIAHLIDNNWKMYVSSVQINLENGQLIDELAGGRNVKHPIHAQHVRVRHLSDASKALGNRPSENSQAAVIRFTIDQKQSGDDSVFTTYADFWLFKGEALSTVQECIEFAIFDKDIPQYITGPRLLLSVVMKGVIFGNTEVALLGNISPDEDLVANQCVMEFCLRVLNKNEENFDEFRQPSSESDKERENFRALHYSLFERSPARLSQNESKSPNGDFSIAHSTVMEKQGMPASMQRNPGAGNDTSYRGQDTEGSQALLKFVQSEREKSLEWRSKFAGLQFDQSALEDSESEYPKALFQDWKELIRDFPQDSFTELSTLHTPSKGSWTGPSLTPGIKVLLQKFAGDLPQESERLADLQVQRTEDKVPFSRFQTSTSPGATMQKPLLPKPIPGVYPLSRGLGVSNPTTSSSVCITKVTPGGWMDALGVREHDVLIEVQGRPAHSLAHFCRLLGEAIYQKQSLSLSIKRDGKLLHLESGLQR